MITLKQDGMKLFSVSSPALSNCFSHNAFQYCIPLTLRSNWLLVRLKSFPRLTYAYMREIITRVQSNTFWLYFKL